jgi:cytochrome c peroxidase
MRKIFVPAFLLAGAALVIGATSASLDLASLRKQSLTTFGTLPEKMPGAEKDTPALVELGRKLYFETRISQNGKMSCNTCHMVDENRAGVDNEPTSEGVHGQRGDRNSPTTLNAGLHLAQFWDGRAKDLEAQAKGPVLNPVEMAMPDEVEVIRRLKEVPEYPKLFKAAFKDPDPISYDNFARAVAAFERTLITKDRFDDFMKGDDKALNAQELAGLNLFLTTGCITCHTGPGLGGNSYQKIGVMHPYSNTNDVGRMKVTGEEWDEYRFKVPSLRNVALTFPYFHDGKVPTLEEAVKTMAHLQLGKELTKEESGQLQAFLNALSDKKRRAVRPDEHDH